MSLTSTSSSGPKEPRPGTSVNAEQIVTILRQIEVGIANGKLSLKTCKEAEITVMTNSSPVIESRAGGPIPVYSDFRHVAAQYSTQKVNALLRR